MQHLISVDELTRQSDAVIIDCRADLLDKSLGRRSYQAGHIPGAQFADLETELASPPGQGGRHPLPARTALLDNLRRWGVNNDSLVVCYDATSGAFAARLWWLCRWLGHDRVSVLDGGLAAWSAAGQPLSAAIPEPALGNITESEPLTRVCPVEQVLDPGHQLIDARDEVRFRGESEPIDPVAGHIPGAICAPFTGNLSADPATSAHFKSSAALAMRFGELGIDPATDLVCYCGSGVTAAHNILALLIAGYPEPALYAGSWSEWITDANRPVETG